MSLGLLWYMVFMTTISLFVTSLPPFSFYLVRLLLLNYPWDGLTTVPSWSGYALRSSVL